MGTMGYPSAEQMFQMQYESVRRDEVVGVLLAIFLGCFGVHHFYVGRTTLGIVYLCLCWTGIPAILGLIECFFMPGRVRAYNAVQAAGIAAALGIAVPAYVAYPGWPAPGFAAPGFAAPGFPAPGVAGQGYAGQAYAGVSYAQPDAPGYAPVYRGAAAAMETTLVVCEKCRMTNPVGARFCSGCGSSIS
jgi:TM2 domain-containing membrane protein YozV